MEWTSTLVVLTNIPKGYKNVKFCKNLKGLILLNRQFTGLQKNVMG